MESLQADLGLAVVGLAYEKVIADHVAVQVEAHVFGTWFGPMFDLPSFAGLGGQIRPTWWAAPQLASELQRHGFYVAPFLRAERVSGDFDDGAGKGSGSGWSGGFFGGWAFPIGDRFDLRIGAGAQYMRYEIIRDRDNARRRLHTFFPALDLVVGWSF